MASYNIEWRASTRKEIRRIAKQEVTKIVDAVNELADNPRPVRAKKLAGSSHAYRLRIGDYRVIYEIFNELVLVEVVRVAHRKNVYK